MSLLSQLKTTVKKSPAKPAVPAIEPPTPAATESVSTSPADDICDLEALAGMLQQLQTRNQQYQRALDALVAARRVVNGWDPKPEPELIWSVRREVLVAMDDKDALARFDRDHAQDLAAEQAARHAATQQALEAPARVKALAGRAAEEINAGRIVLTPEELAGLQGCIGTAQERQTYDPMYWAWESLTEVLNKGGIEA